MKPICVKCRRFYRCKKNGFKFIEGMPMGGTGLQPLPGTAEPEYWTPYKLWAGDLWECEGCHHELVSGVARVPIAEHYQPDFIDRVNASGAILQVNDC